MHQRLIPAGRPGWASHQHCWSGQQNQGGSSRNRCKSRKQRCEKRGDSGSSKTHAKSQEIFYSPPLQARRLLSKIFHWKAASLLRMLTACLPSQEPSQPSRGPSPTSSATPRDSYLQTVFNQIFNLVYLCSFKLLLQLGLQLPDNPPRDIDFFFQLFLSIIFTIMPTQSAHMHTNLYNSLAAHPILPCDNAVS